MVDISRVQVKWEGPAVIGPSVSTFYTSTDPVDLVSDLRTFFSSIQTLFPNGKVSWIFDAGGAVIDSATGELSGSWAGGTATPLPCASSNAFWSQGVGGRITWETGAFLRGRRTRGATYLVPLNISMLTDSDGTLVGSAITSVASACSALITSHPGLTVWSRPTAAGGDGGTATITSGAMPDRVSWLRSRRT